MRRSSRAAPLLGLGLAVAVAVAGCGGETGLYRGSVHSTSATYAGANVAVGAALYAVAGGCKISGCPTNTQCNHVTERCDPMKCGTSDCKGEETCDEKLGHCVPIMVGVSKASPSTNTPPVPTPINAGPNALP